MNLSLVVAGIAAVLSFLIVYQNYIQNATTEREVERDLRDKLLGDEYGKGREGNIFSVAITDLRVHESSSKLYKLRRLLTRKFQADTQLNVVAGSPVVDGDRLDWFEEVLSKEYGFEVHIDYFDSEEYYQFVIGTTHESDIVECVCDFQNTVDKNLAEGNWSISKE